MLRVVVEELRTVCERGNKPGGKGLGIDRARGDGHAAVRGGGEQARGTARAQAVQDVVWALLNAKEFEFNH